MQSPKTYQIAVLPGDGIGPEVMDEAIRVLEAAASAHGFALVFESYPVGGIAIDLHGDPLPEKTQAACRRADAVLLGAVGGPAWDGETGPRRPESGLLKLRKMLGVYANLRPVSVPESLAASSPLRKERVAGTDVLIIRELTGGIYFGKPRGVKHHVQKQTGTNTMRYSEHEIARIARVAFQWAERRSGRVTSVDKANVLEVSQLWREVVTNVHHDEFPQVKLDHLYVDNAAMQLVRDPRQFDVILTGNLFGDILSDLAATLPGSLGLLPSASVGGPVGLFEPVHGSAPDIAGQGKANPLGAILSGAMLLDEFGEGAAAQAVQRGVEAVLGAGMRTADLGGSAPTTEVGRAVAEAVTTQHPVTA